MSLFSTNRFKNLCPEYIEESLQVKQNASKPTTAPEPETKKVAQTNSTNGDEGSKEVKPQDSHIIGNTNEAGDVSIPDDISIEEGYLDYLLESLDYSEE